MEAWEAWRACNIGLALFAVGLNIAKSFYLKLWRYFYVDAGLGFIATMAWCIGYAVATSVAWRNGVPAGVWTAIMSVPIMWTVVAGLTGWKHYTKEV